MVLKWWYLCASFFKKGKIKCNKLHSVITLWIYCQGLNPKNNGLGYFCYERKNILSPGGGLLVPEDGEDPTHVFGSWLRREGSGSHSWAWTSSCGSAGPGHLPGAEVPVCHPRCPRAGWRSAPWSAQELDEEVGREHLTAPWISKNKDHNEDLSEWKVLNSPDIVTIEERRSSQTLGLSKRLV